MKRSLFLLLFASALFVSCHVGRTIVYNFSDINDHKIFPKRETHASNSPFMFYKGYTGYNNIPTMAVVKGKEVPFTDFLVQNETVAFLIIHNDTIVYEKYLMNYDTGSIVPSFSMAKSYTSALIGCALADGLIRSVDQPVTDYIPELKKEGFDSVTIRHLLQMTSGIDFKESYYNPFGDAAKFYYGSDLKKFCLKMKRKWTPGLYFEYNSGSTQLLGFVLQRALKGETITHYLDRRLWFLLGPQYDGSWSIDKEDGIEKTFCCINATARDFAKLGRLYLHKGKWKDKQIIPAKWVEESTTPDTRDGGVDYYKYQWWLFNKNGEDAFCAQGHLGQYLYVCPSKNLIIVRLGAGYGKINWRALFHDIADNTE